MVALLEKLMTLFNVSGRDIHNYFPGSNDVQDEKVWQGYHLTKVDQFYYLRCDKTNDLYLCLTGSLYFYVYQRSPEKVNCVMPSQPTNNLTLYIPEKTFMDLVDTGPVLLMSGTITFEDGRITRWKPFDFYRENTWLYHKALESYAVKTLLALHLIH